MMREAAPNRRISCGQGAKMAGSAKPSNPTMKTPLPAARAAAATLSRKHTAAGYNPQRAWHFCLVFSLRIPLHLLFSCHRCRFFP